MWLSFSLSWCSWWFFWAQAHYNISRNFSMYLKHEFCVPTLPQQLIVIISVTESQVFSNVVSSGFLNFSSQCIFNLGTHFFLSLEDFFFLIILCLCWLSLTSLWASRANGRQYYVRPWTALRPLAVLTVCSSGGYVFCLHYSLLYRSHCLPSVISTFTRIRRK